MDWTSSQFLRIQVLAFTFCVVLSSNNTTSIIESGEQKSAIGAQKNRDDKSANHSVNVDQHPLSTKIIAAHEILRIGLKQYLDFEELDLGTYLSHMIQRAEPYVDEYGQVIRFYKKVFRFIWEQYNETLQHNYAINQFDKDKLDLCSVSRYLSHQSSVDNRGTIMKNMSDALGYQCHPCTPYKPKQYGTTIMPNSDDISLDEATPEEILILCKKYQDDQPFPSPVLRTNTPNNTKSAHDLVTVLEGMNRDGKLPTSTLEADVLLPSISIVKAHEVLRKGLQQYLNVEDADFGTCLNQMIQRFEFFVDEYGQVIANYKKVFRFIWEQFNETVMHNYAVGQFDKDKLDLCSAARYLSHQQTVVNRTTIIKRMSDALGYKCHPCTPYKRKQYDVTIVPKSDSSSYDEVTPEESLILCEKYQENNHNISISTLSDLKNISESSMSNNSSSTDSLCTSITLLGSDGRNRDCELPPNPIIMDIRNKSSLIMNAHEIIRKSLQQYLDFDEADLGIYLSQIIQHTEPYIDEYGQVIYNYKKVFRFIWEQYNETVLQNYAVKQFDKDKLDLCSVARFLSHQPKVKDRNTLMMRIGDSLQYKCHPCTPYKRKQYGETIVPTTDDFSPDGVSPEESLNLCKKHHHQDGFISTVNGTHRDVQLHNKIVVCIVASMAANRPGNGAFSWENINPSLCTHIVISTAGINNITYEINFSQWNPQTLRENHQYRQFLKFKKRNPNIKISLAVGGWAEGSRKYSNMAAKAESRRVFIDSALGFLRKHHLDGLDMDWEFPTLRLGSRVSDKDNFVILLKEMKLEFTKVGMLLTTSIGTDVDTMNKAYDIQNISRYVDYIHVMAHDYHGYWEGTTGHNAPMRLTLTNATDFVSNMEYENSVETTVQYLKEKGAPRNKLVLALPFFGRTFILDDPSRYDIGSLSKGNGFQGPYTRRNGTLGYNEICKLLLPDSLEKLNWTENWDEVSEVPYMYSGEKWVSFDNIRSIGIKVRYAFKEGLAGVMGSWVNNDDFLGECSSLPYPLLRTVHSALDDAAKETEAMSENNIFTLPPQYDTDQSTSSKPRILDQLLMFLAVLTISFCLK